MIHNDVSAQPPIEPPEHPDEIRGREEAMAEQRGVKPGYYYEHVNGTVHWKPFIVVDTGGGPDVYFDSPMVKRWWRVDD